MAASVKGTMAPLARKYEVSFSTKVASDVPLVNGDYEKTTRMLENLASNAIKFTPDGGSIELRVAYDAEARVVTLSMVDDGIGIAARGPGAHLRAVRTGGQHVHAPNTTAAAWAWRWCANTATCKGSPCRWKASSVVAAGSSSRFPRARSWAR